MRQPRVLLFRVQGVVAALGFLLAGAAQASDFVVEARKVSDMKAMFGQVQSRDVTSARTRIGGTLVSRSVDEGTQVKAGDVIAIVSDEKLALQAQSLDGQLSALESQLANANDALQRAQDLLPRGFVTKAAFDQAKTNVDVLQHQVEFDALAARGGGAANERGQRARAQGRPGADFVRHSGR